MSGEEDLSFDLTAEDVLDQLFAQVYLVQSENFTNHKVRLLSDEVLSALSQAKILMVELTQLLEYDNEEEDYE